MSKQIEVFGVLKVSTKYLEKFFKKAGHVSRIQFKRDRVVIRYGSEDQARRALEFSGKIIEDQQIRISLHESPSKETLTFPIVTQYQEFSGSQCALCEQIIWSLDIPIHRKAALSIIYRLKMSQVLFLQRTGFNGGFNSLLCTLQDQFLKSRQLIRTRTTSEGGRYILLSQKFPMAAREEPRVITEKAQIHKDFCRKLNRISPRLYQLYRVFCREALINTFQQPILQEQEFHIQQFSGYIEQRAVSIINSNGKVTKQNLLLIETGPNFWQVFEYDAVLFYPAKTTLAQCSYTVLFHLQETGITREKQITLYQLVFVVEVSLDTLMAQLEQKIKQIMLYKKAIGFQTHQHISVVALVSDQRSGLDHLQVQKLRELLGQSKDHLYVVLVRQTQQRQLDIYRMLLSESVDKAQQAMTTYKAEELAQHLISQNQEELFGRTNVFNVGRDILDLARENPRSVPAFKRKGRGIQ